MPRRYKPNQIVVSDHALARYKERAGSIRRAQLAALVRVCLFNQLRVGKEVKDASVVVYLPATSKAKEIKAVVKPDAQGFWVVETISTDGQDFLKLAELFRAKGWRVRKVKIS